MFFEPSSFQERKLSMDYFREWAGEISSSYLNSGIAPTDTLCKIAQQEDLTPHHIQVLAGEANKEIHRIKYAAAKDKYMAADFPLADAKTAIEKLQADGGSEKVATAAPEPKFQDRGPDPFKMFGVEPEVMDKTASVRHGLKTASIKGELLEQKVGDKALLSKYAADAAEKTFIKQARQMVLSNAANSAERARMLGTIGHFAKSAGMPIAKKPLAKLAYVLGREGLLEPAHAKAAVEYFMSKEADMTAPKELISEWLPAQVVNGNHPLYITLCTLGDAVREGQEADKAHQLVHDRLNLARQKVRAL